MLPTKLLDIIEFLKQTSLKLSENSRDGRINSAFNEDEIFNVLDEKFKIIRPDKRDWYDFAFEENGTFYPVNIKVSTTKTADNLNCKLGIYYALAGRIPRFNNETNWVDFFKAIKENLKENNKDYYFLVINKDDTNDIFATSLKNLNELTPNGNNLPFQANWTKNKTLKNRNFDEAKVFILSTMAKSFALRAKVYSEFLHYFPEFQVIQND